ncbi:MAG: SDR family oxidoreductase, partial [Myxococcales bacterium]|nr:SDR family oxidoreductase [Myxococcales bacterium]
YLITGGAGFIGSNLAHALVHRGEQVRILDNFATGREENIAELVEKKKLELLRGSIADAEAVARAMRGIDYVLHQAAIPSVPRSIEDPLGGDDTNVHGTVTVLDGARKAGVKRVVFAASSSAYGEKAPGEPKVETMLPAPLSPYAAAKLAGEYYMQAFYHSYGLETVALRYFNIFGPRQDPKSQYAAVIPNFVTAALQGRAATIYGDGETSRDFCFVENAVEANLLACTAPGAAGEVFNVACGESTSLLQTVDIIARIVGKKIPPMHEAPRTGDIKYSLADISKAKKILGYTGRIKFAEGLERTIAWYKETL